MARDMNCFLRPQRIWHEPPSGLRSSNTQTQVWGSARDKHTSLGAQVSTSFSLMNLPLRPAVQQHPPISPSTKNWRRRDLIYRTCSSGLLFPHPRHSIQFQRNKRAPNSCSWSYSKNMNHICRYRPHNSSSWCGEKSQWFYDEFHYCDDG